MIKKGQVYKNKTTGDTVVISNPGVVCDTDETKYVIFQNVDDKTLGAEYLDTFNLEFEPVDTPCHTFSIEKLYHFKCPSCKSWWSIGDFNPSPESKLSCPHCGTKAGVINGG